MLTKLVARSSRYVVEDSSGRMMYSFIFGGYAMLAHTHTHTRNYWSCFKCPKGAKVAISYKKKTRKVYIVCVWFLVVKESKSKSLQHSRKSTKETQSKGPAATAVLLTKSGGIWRLQIGSCQQNVAIQWCFDWLWHELTWYVWYQISHLDLPSVWTCWDMLTTS